MSGLTALLGALRRRHRRVSLLVRFEPLVTTGGSEFDLDTPPDEAQLFAAGTTDALIERFERAVGVDVIGPSSARSRSALHPLEGQGGSGEGPEAGSFGDERLPSVDFVLRGRLASEGATLRVEAEMIGSSGRSAWSETWIRPVAEIFELHGDIARRAADALGVSLPVTGGGLIHREPTSDPDAYRAYLEGLWLLRREDGLELLEKILERFQSALDLDALFADPWSGIAATYRLAGESGRPLAPLAPAEAVREAAGRALELDPSAAAPRLALAWADIEQWRLGAAEERIREVVAVAPGHAQGHRSLARCLCYQGRFEEARGLAEHAAALEPLDPTVVNESGWPYALAGEAAAAIERSRRAVRLDPEHVMTYFHLGQYAQQVERPAEAVTYFRAAAELSGRLPFLSAFLGTALIAVGERHEAESLAADLERKAARGSPVATALASLLARLGRVDDALFWLEAALERRESLLLLADSHWLPLPELRHDARFDALLERLPRPSAAGWRP